MDPKVIPNLELLERLGKGGFGSVYRARDLVLERDLAVKFLHTGVAGDESTVQRFFREARLLARLTGNPHIPIVFQAGWAGEIPYMVMELVQGPDLGKKIREWYGEDGLTAAPDGGPLRMSRTYILEVLKQIAVALSDTHEHGIVHRDLKPANVVIVEDRLHLYGLVKVLDFGVARDPTPADGERTATGSIIGTPAYMAPELFDGERATAASDVYAFGVLAYELCTGERPVKGKSPLQVAKAHARGGPIPIERVNEVQTHPWPPEFLTLLEAVLHTDPGTRPGAVQVLSQLSRVDQAIEDWRAQRGK